MNRIKTIIIVLILSLSFCFAPNVPAININPPRFITDRLELDRFFHTISKWVNKLFAGKYFLSSYDDLADAVSDIGSDNGILIIDEDLIMKEDITVPSTLFLEFIPGNVITTSTVHVLTISSPGNIISARDQQIFSTDGTVEFSKCSVVNPEMWGAVHDGITDDGESFQSAFDTGCDVEISNKTSGYLIDGDDLEITHSNQRLFGGGWLKFESGASICTFSTNFTTFDGNYLENITIQDLKITGTGSTADQYALIYLVGINNLTVKNLDIRNAGEIGQSPQSCGIGLFFVKNGTIEDNYIYGVSGTGILNTNPVGRIVIAHNHIEHSGDDGINGGYWSVDGNGDALYASYMDECETIIQGNTIYDTQSDIDGGHGAYAISLNTYQSDLKLKWIVDGNTMIKLGRGAIRGLDIGNNPTEISNSKVIITNNYIQDIGNDSGTLGANRASGIWLEKVFKSAIVSNNYIEDSAQGYGIYIHGASSSITPEEITLTDNQVINVKEQGYRFTNVKRLILSNNYFKRVTYSAGSTAIGYYLGPTESLDFNGNISDNAEDSGFYFYLPNGGDVNATITANKAIDSGTHGYEFQLHDSIASTGIIFKGNQERGSTTDALEFNTNSNMIQDSVFTDNIFGTSPATAAITDIDLTNGGNTIRGNINGLIAENQGNATIPISQQSVVVTHGLSTTPKVVLATGSTSDSNSLYVDTIGATQFTLHVVGAVGDNRTVYWWASCNIP